MVIFASFCQTTRMPLIIYILKLSLRTVLCTTFHYSSSAFTIWTLQTNVCVCVGGVSVCVHLYMCVCMSECGCMFICMCTIYVQVPMEMKRGVRFPRTGVIEGYVLFGVSSRKQTWIFYESYVLLTTGSSLQSL